MTIYVITEMVDYEYVDIIFATTDEDMAEKIAKEHSGIREKCVILEFEEDNIPQPRTQKFYYCIGGNRR